MANFYLKIDKPFYFAGDVVTGHLLINVLQPVEATGISLKFSGYQCVKWSTKTEILRPGYIDGRPPPQGDPLNDIHPHKIFHTDRFDVSDIDSEDREGWKGRRPEYILTPKGKLYKMRYSEARNLFCRVKSMIYQCHGLMPGQYSFPVSFKTFEGWPATFDYNLPSKKGRISYHLSAQIEPENTSWSMKCGTEVLIRQSKALQSPIKQSITEVKSCCCSDKGRSGINVHFEKDGYMPGDVVRVVIEVDNSECQADIDGLKIAIVNTIGLRSNNNFTSDNYTIFSKQIAGTIAAGEKMLGSQSIIQSFPLVSQHRSIKPTCNGKLLSSVYDVRLGLTHNVSCACCAGSPEVSQRVMIFPSMFEYSMPSTFSQSSWQPKLMPVFDLMVNNSFMNFKIGVMAGNEHGDNGNYPPQPAFEGGYNKLSDEDYEKPKKGGKQNQQNQKNKSKSKGKH